MIDHEIDRLKALLDDLFNNFNEVKKEMEFKVKHQKKYYEKNSVYMSLEYCSKSDCIFCPHYFEWRQTIQINTPNGKKNIGKRLGRKITHKILKQIGKNNMYPIFRKLEQEMKELQKKRDFYAKNIQKIQRILRESQKYLNK